MRYTGLYILLLAAAACGGEKNSSESSLQQNNAALDTSAEVAKTDTLTEIPIVLKPGKGWTFEQKIDSFLVAYNVNYTEEKNEKRHVLMRFENAWMHQTALLKRFSVQHKKEETYPIAWLGFYSYTDSAQCANAVSNWLACFGSDCQQIEFEKETDIKSNPGFYIVNEKEIVTLDMLPEHDKNNWEEMKKNLRILFATRNSRIIHITNKGEVIWEK